jgi:O-antigen/teichoic acid export membrane protein
MSERQSSLSSQQSAYYHQRLASVGKRSSIALLGGLFGRAIQLVCQVLLARLLEAAAFGQYAFGLLLLQGVTALLSLGLDTGVVRYIALYRAKSDEARLRGTIHLALFASILVALSAAAVLLVFAEQIVAVTRISALTADVVRAYAIVLPAWVMLNLVHAMLRAFEQVKYATFGKDILQPAVQVAALAVFVVWQLTVVESIVSLAISATVSVAVCMLMLERVFPAWRHGSVVREGRLLFSFSLPLAAWGFLHFLNGRIDAVLVGIALPVEALGAYQGVLVLVISMSLIISSFNIVLAPVFSRLYGTGDSEQLRYMYQTTTRWMITLGLLPFLCVTLFSTELIVTFFGPSYVIAWQALIILFFGELVNLSVGSVNLLLVMSGRQKLVLVNTVLVGIASVPLTWVLIQQWGIVGAAVAATTITVFDNLLRLAQVRWLLGIHPYRATLFKPLLAGVAAVVVGSITSLVFPAPWWMLSMVLSVCSYLGVLLLLGLDDSERALMQQLVARRT